MRAISSPAGQLLAFQEGFSSMEVATWSGGVAGNQPVTILT